MVTIAISQQTYDEIIECLQQEHEPEAIAPVFIENALRRRLRHEAYIGRLADKEELTEDEVMELATAAVHFTRDCQPKK